MTSDVSLSTALGQQTKTQTSQAGLGTDFNDFLQLLTTQLQNQDPLSPMDTTQFTNQLVAFTGVEQQINTNQKLDNLVALQLGNSLGSSVNYVGLDASYVGNEFSYDGTKNIKVNYALDKEAVSNTINVYDEDKTLVYTAKGATATGVQEFTWDGTTTAGPKAPVGTYTVSIDSFDENGTKIDSTAVVSGRVTGVETQNGVIYLLIGDRAVPLSSVLNAKEPPVTTTATTPDTDTSA